MVHAIKHLKADDYKIMPWKNGGGSTTELAIHPPGSGVNDIFSWRISLAQLDGSGPFSTFPGYDRIIVQIKGKPMTLVHDAHVPQTLIPSVPYAFSGDWTTSGQLHGHAEDFNVMVRRDSFRCALDVLEIHGIKDEMCEPLTFLWVARGQLKAKSATQSFAVSEHESLRIDTHTRLELQSEDARVFKISLMKCRP